MLAVALMCSCSPDTEGSAELAGAPRAALEPSVLDPATRASSTSVVSGAQVPDLRGVTAEIVLTRQRDLVERGLLNVLVRNDSAAGLVVTSRRLVSDGFDTPGADGRAATIRAGRDIALQVGFGDVVGCGERRTTTAALELEYTRGDDDTMRRAVLAVEGTDVLDDIRAARCAAVRLFETVEVELFDVEIGERSLAMVLELRRVDEDVEVRVEGVRGTVLFDARVTDSASLVEAELEGRRDMLSIPVELTVNRCDPHALAEVTKMYGLEIVVSVDGEPAQPVPIPLDGVVPGLDEIVERCRAALVPQPVDAG